MTTMRDDEDIACVNILLKEMGKSLVKSIEEKSLQFLPLPFSRDLLNISFHPKTPH
jgi:hypothetical protein